MGGGSCSWPTGNRTNGELVKLIAQRRAVEAAVVAGSVPVQVAAEPQAKHEQDSISHPDVRGALTPVAGKIYQTLFKDTGSIESSGSLEVVIIRLMDPGLSISFLCPPMLVPI